MELSSNHSNNNRIASLLAELGYGSTFSGNVILAVLEQLQIYPSNASAKITPKEIAACLAMMASTHSGLEVNPSLKAIASPLLDEASYKIMEQMKTWNLELFYPLVKKMVFPHFVDIYLESLLGLVASVAMPGSP